jgi:hypothetical protein
MKRAGLIAAAILAAFALAQDKVKVTPKLEEGQSTTVTAKIKMDVGGAEALITADLTQKLTKKAEPLEWEINWANSKVTVDGNEMEAPISAIMVKTKGDGIPTSIEGGISGTDSTRTFLTVYHIIPTMELAKDEKQTLTMAKSETLGTDEITLEIAFAGMEGEDFKFVLKGKEKTGDFNFENTYVVNKDGKLLKLDGKFSNLPIPIAGTNGSGSIELRAK